MPPRTDSSPRCERLVALVVEAQHLQQLYTRTAIGKRCLVLAGYRASAKGKEFTSKDRLLVSPCKDCFPWLSQHGLFELYARKAVVHRFRCRSRQRNSPMNSRYKASVEMIEPDPEKELQPLGTTARFQPPLLNTPVKHLRLSGCNTSGDDGKPRTFGYSMSPTPQRSTVTAIRVT